MFIHVCTCISVCVEKIKIPSQCCRNEIKSNGKKKNVVTMLKVNVISYEYLTFKSSITLIII